MTVTVVLTEGDADRTFPQADGWTFTNNGDLTLTMQGNGFVSFAAGTWKRVDLGSVVVPMKPRT